jgi:hypothetical protein
MTAPVWHVLPGRSTVPGTRARTQASSDFEWWRWAPPLEWACARVVRGGMTAVGMVDFAPPSEAVVLSCMASCRCAVLHGLHAATCACRRAKTVAVLVGRYQKWSCSSFEPQRMRSFSVSSSCMMSSSRGLSQWCLALCLCEDTRT